MFLPFLRNKVKYTTVSGDGDIPQSLDKRVCVYTLPINRRCQMHGIFRNSIVGRGKSDRPGPLVARLCCLESRLRSIVDSIESAWRRPPASTLHRRDRHTKGSPFVCRSGSPDWVQALQPMQPPPPPPQTMSAVQLHVRPAGHALSVSWSVGRSVGRSPPSPGWSDSLSGVSVARSMQSRHGERQMLCWRGPVQRRETAGPVQHIGILDDTKSVVFQSADLLWNFRHWMEKSGTRSLPPSWCRKFYDQANC